jgi:pimeloyl-ACP methyl ester carboxylesterase
MGGTLAYTFASLYPDSVDRLILADTGPGEKPPEAGAQAERIGPRPGGPPPMPAGPFTSPEDAAAQVPKAFGPAFAKAMVQYNLKQTADGRWHWKYDQKGTAAAGEQSRRDTRKWPRWNAVKCPALILRGERSPALPQRIAELMVTENKNASLVVVPNAGHFIPIEQPAAFEAAVREWLGIQRVRSGLSTTVRAVRTGHSQTQNLVIVVSPIVMALLRGHVSNFCGVMGAARTT